MKNVTEIPRTKPKVFLNSVLLKNLGCLLSKLSILLLDNTLRYTGKIGKIQGDKKDISPSINTIIKFRCSICPPFKSSY